MVRVTSPQNDTSSAERPPRRLPAPFGLYYGWIMVAAALAMNFSMSPMNPVVFSFFLLPMSLEMGWTRSQLALALSFRLLAAGFSGPILGRLLDRIGSRWLGVVGGLIGGCSLIASGAVMELWQLYLIYAISGMGGMGGPGGNLLTTVPVAKWFIAKRGRAMTIASVGMPAGTTLSIPLTQWLIGTIGWRRSWMVYGGIAGPLISLLSGLVMRRAPEDYGLHPDGVGTVDTGQVNTGKARPQPATTEANWTLGQTVRTTTFWIVLPAFALSGFALSGTLVHRVAFWQDQGIPLPLIALGTSVDPFTVVFSGLFFGFLGERLSVRVLGLVAGIGLACSMVPMVVMPGEAYGVFLHNFLWGAAIGAFITVNNLVWATYYGRRSLGAIQGIVLPVSIISNAIAAPGYGLLLDVGVQPALVWSLSLALFATTGGLLTFARPPKLPQPAPATA